LSFKAHTRRHSPAICHLWRGVVQAVDCGLRAEPWAYPAAPHSTAPGPKFRPDVRRSWHARNMSYRVCRLTSHRRSAQAHRRVQPVCAAPTTWAHARMRGCMLYFCSDSHSSHPGIVEQREAMVLVDIWCLRAARASIPAIIGANQKSKKSRAHSVEFLYPCSAAAGEVQKGT
jgi:hypothetical protein